MSAPVVSGGRAVGTVQLIFGTPAASSAVGVAWWWIGAAAVAALAVALAVSWFVSRRLAVPLVRLNRAARSFAGGDRAARSGVTGPGELGDLGRAFDGMAEEVTRFESARRLLAADIAHELRTPLAALQAGLEELRDGLEPPSPQRLASQHDQALRLAGWWATSVSCRQPSPSGCRGRTGHGPRDRGRAKRTPTPGGPGPGRGRAG